MKAKLLDTRAADRDDVRFELAPPPVVYVGNRVRLLVNGEQYFPELLAAIESARRSIHLETYIFADDNIGRRVADALAAAAARGVAVRLLIDGYGGGEFARQLVRELGVHGAEVRIYRPERWWRLERKLLRRLHRKLAVFDDRLAFVGGINIIDDYPREEGGRLGPRFDFAVACEGPIVAAIALAAKRLWWTLSFVDPRTTAGRMPLMAQQPRLARFPDGVAASLLLRDNLRNRRTIERAYLNAIGGSRHEILIANAYFFPGRRFRAALRDAAARGVRVRLLLQGRIEYALAHLGQQALYGQLLDAGVEIYEYVPSYLHAKVAVIDGHWATVGSSNIDPYSLLLAREANIVVYDAGFARQLQSVLERAIAEDAYRLRAADYRNRRWWLRLANWLAYGVLRLATVILARGRDY
ncbi:MAG TPA: cardiolipin synthase ClsB [Burkholderiaceae bacterium]|nr:cardiolipin synthase ClsB [Burkholderiaceae bacterium]